MKLTKRSGLIITGALIMGLALTGCSAGDGTDANKNITSPNVVKTSTATDNGIVKYNTNPDVSSKVIGSELFKGYRLPIKSLSQLTEKADLIVIGTVVDEGKIVKVSMSDGQSTDPLQAKLESTGGEFSFDTAQQTIKIHEVLYGDPELKEITYSQLGVIGNDDGQTKVKQNKKYLFVLKKDPIRDVYASVSFEEGLYQVDDNDKVKSLSANLELSKYDTLDLKTLKDDLKKAKKAK
ncbi:hypothetical protein [Paenibacillus sp. MMS18-CY102]|uniref:hypothetical protein n=1 Tax=Paenibacillus sp. MMS18-CY102 TaxID=2682849 RepID=UPI00136534B6|nr:hypothetical protein [Paenibacillus sp. MMS18-CY102]MWC31050.1 hypothetical protein [Paenibacillus sp. MMS18-CY102]